MREGEAPSELAVEAARLIGRTIGSYRVVRLLGAGGMGAVYLGEHPGIGSKVAIKLLHPRFAADKGMIERFFNEARAVNVIGHDNIIKVLDFSVTADGRHFFVMEFLHGHTLESLLHQRQPLPLTVTAPIFLQCCRALQAAHERGIVHRDLKPDNVFLTRHGDREHFVKLLDFGIAKLSDVSASRRTQTGVVLGTPEYMSPEQAAGDVNSIDARSDIYSLGVMMFEGATGRTPFGGPGVLLRSILNGHVSRSPPAPRSLAPEVPEAYERVVLRCLEKEPASRWQSMADLHRAIEETLRALRLVAERPMVHPEQQLHTTVAEEVTAAEPEAATAALKWPYARANASRHCEACASCACVAVVGMQLVGFEGSRSTKLLNACTCSPLIRSARQYSGSSNFSSARALAPFGHCSSTGPSRLVRPLARSVSQSGAPAPTTNRAPSAVPSGNAKFAFNGTRNTRSFANSTSRLFSAPDQSGSGRFGMAN